MAKARLYFDMDGTLADLYSVPDWKEKLDSEMEGVYVNAEPLIAMDRLTELCSILQKLNYEIGVITWLPKHGTPQYKAKVEQEKREWLARYFPIVDIIKVVDYGVNKSHCAKKGKAILFDDNETVRSEWQTPKERKAVSNENIFQELLNLLLTELVK